MAPRLTVVQIGTLGDDGDGMYRLHQAAAALAALDGVEVYNVHHLVAAAWPAVANRRTKRLVRNNGLEVSTPVPLGCPT